MGFVDISCHDDVGKPQTKQGRNKTIHEIIILGNIRVHSSTVAVGVDQNILYFDLDVNTVHVIMTSEKNIRSTFRQMPFCTCVIKRHSSHGIIRTSQEKRPPYWMCYTCMHACIHTYKHTYIHTHIHVYKHVDTHTHILVHHMIHYVIWRICTYLHTCLGALYSSTKTCLI